MIYIVGHKNPDTDSIASAIVMAAYFKKRGEKSKAIRVGKINKETSFVLNKARVKMPPLVKSLANKKVFLVDHNEVEQAGDNLEKAEIFGILDHHRLGGGIKTETPIYVRMESVGSTCTLVFKLFQEMGFKLTKNQAFLLLAGIISDTLKLTSPTTTKEDKEIAKILARTSQIDIDNFSQEIFKARSDISSIKLKDLIYSDYKELKERSAFFSQDLFLGIGVHETLNPGILLKKEKEILSILQEVKKERKLDLIFFALIDILEHRTFLFLLEGEEKKISEKAFSLKVRGNLLLLPGVVSRKKQIVPAFLRELNFKAFKLK